MVLDPKRELKPYKELLVELDATVSNKKGKMKFDDLLDIFIHCERDDIKQKDLTDTRQKQWFTLMGRVDIKDISDLELLALPRIIENLKLNPTQHFPKFYEGWEFIMINTLTARGLVAVLEQYLRWNADIPVEIFNKWNKKAAGKAGVISAKDLCRIMYLLGKLEVKPDDAFLGGCLDKVYSSLSSLSATSISEFIYGAGKLEIEVTSGQMEKIGAAVQKLESKFEPSDFVSCMYGFSLLNKVPEECKPKWIAKYFEKVGSDMHTLTAKEITRAFWAPAKLRFILGSMPASFIDRWTAVAQDKAKQFEPGDLMLILDAAAWVKTPQKRTFWSVYEDGLERKLTQVWPDVLAKIMVRMHEAGVASSKDFNKIYMKTALRMLTKMYAENLVNLIRGFKDQKMQPDEFDINFLHTWQEEAALKSFYFDRQTSVEIRQIFKHWDKGMSDELNRKLYNPK